LAENPRTPGRVAQPELDAEVENLARKIAELVNTAGVENRQDLREYAIELLKEETERDDASTAPPNSAPAQSFSPLALAILVGLASLPLLVLFTPLGMGLFVVAVLLGIWGLIDTFVRR
jgi:hypothetical protein